MTNDTENFDQDLMVGNLRYHRHYAGTKKLAIMPDEAKGNCQLISRGETPSSQSSGIVNSVSVNVLTMGLEDVVVLHCYEETDRQHDLVLTEE